MNKYTAISTSISESEWRETNKFRLKPTMIIRRAVKDEIRKGENHYLIERMEKIRPIISKLNKEKIVSDLQEDREG